MPEAFHHRLTLQFIQFYFLLPLQFPDLIQPKPLPGGHSLPFLLLADPELTAIQAYGVWQEKKLYGKVSMGVVRTTFLIDREGRIQKVMPKVKPDTNAAEVLACLRGE